jgi:hypothetical protein
VSGPTVTSFLYLPMVRFLNHTHVVLEASRRSAKWRREAHYLKEQRRLDVALSSAPQTPIDVHARWSLNLAPLKLVIWRTSLSFNKRQKNHEKKSYHVVRAAPIWDPRSLVFSGDAHILYLCGWQIVEVHIPCQSSAVLCSFTRENQPSLPSRTFRGKSST